jgi:acetyl esterase/lipase
MRSDRNGKRRQLLNLLGDLPDRQRSVSVEKVGEVRREAFWLEKLVLGLNGIEDVPAYFVRPHEAEGPLPAILFNHAHGGEYHIGKEEVISGRGGQQKPPFGEALTRAGYCVLCIDHWAFGERRGRTESEIFKEMLWRGQVMWGMMAFDSIRAVDYLVSRPDVDAERLATMGVSMGSTMAWWLAALDTRIKVCIDICCLTDFDALIERRGLEGHGIYYYVPNLLKRFTTSDINALISPRPHLSLAGNFDPLTPPKGLDRVDAELKKVYAEAGAPEAWKLIRYGCGHMETAAMRSESLAFLAKWL